MSRPPDAAWLEQARAWLRADPCPRTRAALAHLVDAGDEAGVAAAFSRRVSFGTAGLRATVGPGPAHINRLVVRQTAFGLVTYARSHIQAAALARGAVVGFDGRADSQTFAEDVVGTLVAQGMPVILFDRPVPTPQVGFAVRHLGAALGIVITASHNPPAYNGMKIYWANGVQVLPPHDAGIARAIMAGVAAHLAPPWTARQAWPMDASGVQLAPASLEDAYLAAIVPAPPAGTAPTAYPIAYSPLHGVGLDWVTRGLARAGFGDFAVVATQARPDGSFPTLSSPNPEEPEAMREVIALAAARGAKLALATDPDADRLAVAAPLDGGWQQLTGDEIGALLADALIPDAPADAVLATSLVSSPLVGRMAEAAHLTHFTTPTGFKWLADGMQRAKAMGMTPLLAYEEALGFALGEAVWDKDGVAALVVLVRTLAAWEAKGQSVWDRLALLAERFGVVVTCQRTAVGGHAERLSGSALRAQTPAHIGGHAVRVVRDLMVDTWAAPQIGRIYPPQDVLIYTLDTHASGPVTAQSGVGPDSLTVLVRPSGTEPKVKCYYILTAPPPAVEGHHAAHRRHQRFLARLADSHMSQQ